MIPELKIDLDYSCLLHEEGVVLTNGCFDLLHVGHVRFLQRASDFGLRLFVAVNSDESVKMLKGEGRPLMPLLERMEMLAGLSCVSFVTSFPDINVSAVIRHLQPHCWIKGGDYTMQTLNKLEVQAAKDVGAAIILLEKFGDYSTTEILRRMKVEPKRLCPNCGSETPFNLEQAGPDALVCPDCGSAMRASLKT